MSPSSLRRVSGSRIAFSGFRVATPGALTRLSVEGRVCRDFVVKAAKMSEVVRGRLGRCPEMRLTCSGWWGMVLAMALTVRRSRMCGAR